jgi:hypothetical protein
LKKSEKLGYGLHIRTSEIQDFGADWYTPFHL